MCGGWWDQGLHKYAAQPGHIWAQPFEKVLEFQLLTRKEKYKFYLPKTKVELVREQSVELRQVHVWGYMGCHLQEGAIKSKVPFFSFFYMHWSSQGRSMDSSFQLMWGAPSLQFGHSCLQLVVKLLGRPSQLTVAIYTSYLHGHKHSIRSIFSFNAFCQNLKPVIVGKVSWEMPHTSTNIKNTLNPLVSFNAVDKPVQFRL